jgi:hypothetical protein
MVADDALTSARDGAHRLIASWRDAPAFLVDRQLTVVVSNELARAVSPAFRTGSNLVRFTFLEPLIDRSTPLFEAAARQVVALLRDSLDKYAGDASLRSITGDLLASSADFATAWADEPFTASEGGTATFQATAAGDIRLAYVLLRMPSLRDHTLFAWVPQDPLSASALRELSALDRADGPA